MMRRNSRLLRAALLLAALPTLAAAQGDGDRVDTTLVLDRGGLVQLDGVAGEVRVTGSDRRDVKIDATIERGRFELTTSSGRIALRTRSASGRQTGARMDVAVPVGTRLRIGTVSGTVTVRGSMGEVIVRSTSGSVEVTGARERLEVNSVSGEIEVNDATGRIALESVSGGITAEDVEGDLTAEAVSGDVDIRRARLRELGAKVLSGSIRYDGSLAANGTYRLNAHSGSVTMVLPANSSAALSLETFSGRINSEFPLTLQPGETGPRRGRRMEFTLGQGGAQITAGAFSGSIYIRRGAATTR